MTTPINTSIFCQTVASAAFGLAVVGGTSSDAWSQHAPQAIAAELTAARDPTEVYGPGYRLVEGEGYRDAAGRVPVSLGLRLIQLSDIDSKEETFTVEGVL